MCRVFGHVVVPGLLTETGKGKKVAIPSWDRTERTNDHVTSGPIPVIQPSKRFALLANSSAAPAIRRVLGSGRRVENHHQWDDREARHR
jgi:hypothetical protein